MKLVKTMLFTLCLLWCFSGCIGQDYKKTNRETLDNVIQTMNTRYFDPTFGGMNWDSIVGHYESNIVNCKKKDSLNFWLNKMLFELNVSHLGVISAEEAEEVGDPQLFFEGSLGLDVRIIDVQAIVTNVLEGSSSWKKGIKAGDQILKIAGKTIDSISLERINFPTPPFNLRNLNAMITQDIKSEFYGEPGQKVDISFKNYWGETNNLRLLMQERLIKKAVLTPDLPAIYSTVEAKLLNEQIAYIRFDVFHPVLLDTLIELIDGFKYVPGMILDIRGNPGGDFNTRKTLAEQFVDERKLFWIYHHRDRLREVFLQNVDKPYMGKVVILVDELSGSSSEEFSGAMQDIDRATIIGNRTPGKVLTMEFTQLPEGAFMIYPNSQTRTSKDRILEGEGVIPDFEVELEIDDLRKGIDTQLEAAIECLEI